jgi:hypothetical protein
MAQQLGFHKMSAAEAAYFMMPAQDASTLTASDSGSLNPTRALWVGQAGDVAVQMAADTKGTGGTSVTIKGVAQGSLLPLSVVKVKATGTTASDVVALW